jgi:EAL domain-containing protein (putative c-di-GMP-specific phosphodiesterase class I)
MEDDRFVLAFQRFESISGTEEPGWAEMLVRIRTLDGTTHMPSAFLPPAERYGIAHVVDQWITSRCLRWLHEGSAAREGVFRCSINLSGATLSKESFLYFVEEQLERYPVKAENLCFEVTETVAISNLRAAQKFFERFKARGCTFALDDFGSGVSSFRYLRNLPVDYLKIDGGFVRDMDSDALNMEFVRSIHSIGKIMNLKTIAEFVETPRVLGLLREIGVDYGQGYFLHEPTHATMRPNPDAG